MRRESENCEVLSESGAKPEYALLKKKDSTGGVLQG